MPQKIRAEQILEESIRDDQIHPTARLKLTKLEKPVIAADGSQVFTSDQSMGGFRLTRLGVPVETGDATSKSYVDGVATGLDLKGSVRVATTTPLPANTRSDNVLTANTPGVLPPIDGVTLVVEDRILVKNETLAAHNGLYRVITLGSATTPWQLQRTEDADSSLKVTTGMFTFVEEGIVNGHHGFTLVTPKPIVLNTTPLTFTQFSGAGMIEAGDGLRKEGNILHVRPGRGIRILEDTVAVFFQRDEFTATQNDETFLLTAGPVPGSALVFLNGLLQMAGDYFIDMNDLYFKPGIQRINDQIIVYYLRYY